MITHTDVIIIGAGPTGLMAANQLSRFGINYLILDSKPGPTRESRAIVVSARSLEIYQQLGIVDEVIHHGKKIESFHVYSDGNPQISVNFTNIGKGLSDFFYILGYEQSKNEELLYRHIQADNRDVLWNSEFVNFQEADNKVIVEAKQHDKPITIEAKYLIGCDGAHSPVRHQLQSKFSGGTYENKFIVADTTLNWEHDYNQLLIAPGRHNFVAFIPLYGNHSYRIIGTLPRQFYNKDDISFEDIEQTIKHTAGFKLDFEQVNWFSVYKLHHRHVEKFNSRRVFLAGDSAHIHSPAGGQGMNTGLQDAYNLCWKLAMVLQETANENLLNTYNEERLPFADWLVNTTDRMFGIMTSDHIMLHWLRKYVIFRLIRLAIKFQYTRKRMFNTVSQLWYSYYRRSLSVNASRQHLLFKAGDRLPYFDHTAQGKSYYDQFNAPGWHLLHIGDTPLSQDQQIQLNTLFPFPVKLVENKLTQAWNQCGVQYEIFLLIRPDNYIAFITDSLEQQSLHCYRAVLDKYFNKNSSPSNRQSRMNAA